MVVLKSWFYLSKYHQVFGWDEAKGKTVQILKPKTEGFGSKICTSERMLIWDSEELTGERSPSNSYSKGRNYTNSDLALLCTMNQMLHLELCNWSIGYSFYDVQGNVLTVSLVVTSVK